jgi:hypothetical protein
MKGCNQKDRLINHLLRRTRECGGGPILTWTLASPHSVASYDTQGDAEDHILTQILTGLYIFSALKAGMGLITYNSNRLNYNYFGF